jgi:sucrose-6-phosphate hydrolase SacC (GH32 family)
MTISSYKLTKLGLAILAASKAFADPLPEQPKRRPDEPLNPGFETGNLQGWQVVHGNAFGNRSVADLSTYWGGPFYQDQKHFILGTAQAGESAVGELRSSSFRASSALSFLIGGGYDPDNLYVGLVRDRDGQLLLKQTGTDDEALIRIVWDTKKWSGQKVHLVVHDNSTNESWGHINFDDLRLGDAALGNGPGLTFQTIGQANQPPARKGQPACSLYAKDPLRPQYHYTQYQGWINDPAGLVQWKGRHHLFSQFYPDAPFWGPMHWSHAVSPDAVHWRELPVALTPKPAGPGDDSGRFTGSAMVHGDELHLVLTDYVDTRAHPGAIQENVIVASSRDGVNFTLSPRNPVIPAPPAGAPAFFRDPKVFHDPTDNSWKLVIGASNGVQGQVRLYRSTDPFSWSHVGVMYTGDESTDALWECPNFFPLGDKWVLFYGSKGVGLYETGTYNGTVFLSEKRGLVDAGPASYAMQWYKDESGRDLAISWMANWPTSKWPTRANGWAGQQSITRELFLRADGGLGSRPIAELDSLATGPAKRLGPLRVGDKAVTIGNTNTARLKLTIDLKATSASSLTLSLFQSRAESTLLTYHTGKQTLTLDTTNAGYGQAGKWEAVLAKPADNKLALDIFLDRSVLEVFAGDGTVMSATVWPRFRESRGISVTGHQGTVALSAVSVTPLGSSWC